MIKIYKLFLMVTISFFVALNFTEIKKDKLEYEVEQHFRFLSDTIYRYQINAFNAKLVTNETSDLLYLNNPKNNDKVNDISEIIKDFFHLVSKNRIVNDNLWTVANIYPNYIYIKPYRDGYKELLENHGMKNKSYFNYLVKSERIKRNLERSNLTVYETIKVYGPYIEDETNEEIISIYYPLYLDRKIESILSLDIKAGFLSDYVSEFNKRNLTYFRIDENIDIETFVFNIIAKQRYCDPVEIPIQRSYFFFPLLVIVIYLFLFVAHESISLLIKNINDNKKDKLTGFYRKDCFNTTSHSINCIIVIDIDHFKKVNDTYGHPIGDSVIAEVSDRIRNAIRKTDIGIRWGGEEFVVLLDGVMSITDLHIKLNELLHVISDKKICNIDITISIGAFLSPSNVMLSDAFKYADEALYESKRTGRNKYTVILH